MKKYFFFLWLACISLWASDYTHLVILGDPHLPGKHLQNKEKVLQTINEWNDVDAVVAIGDMCEWLGDEREYSAVQTYFSALTKPLFAIAGNHDYIYADSVDENEKLQKGTHELQQQKLATFQKVFGLPKLYRSVIQNGYLLIFLSVDEPKYLAGIGKEQLFWLRKELEQNRHLPTIIFFHAPLDKTLDTYKHWVNTPSFIAQPVDSIKKLIAKNPQIFLWVSGHTHTSPKEESFASAINLYENQVTNIHNTDMNKEIIWTNSLLLYQDKVVIKTYNHNEKKWLDSFERIIYPPKLR